MEAAVLHGPSDLRIEDVEAPVPAPGEVTLRVEAALADAGDLRKLRRGARRENDVPARPGRFCVGHVEAVGRDVEGAYGVGQRVLPASTTPCGTCGACSGGRTEQCEAPIRLEGTFAQSVVVPAAIVATSLHLVPAGLEPTAALLAEPLACVLKGRDRLPARAGERAVVVGASSTGLLWTRVLALTDVHVTMVDARKDRCVLAGHLGAHEVTSRPRDGQADFVVVAGGGPAAWDIALRAAAPGGRVLIASGAASGAKVDVDAGRVYGEELMIAGVRGHTPYHFAEGLRGLAAGILDADTLVTERVALADLPAFATGDAVSGVLPPFVAVSF